MGTSSICLPLQVGSPRRFIQFIPPPNSVCALLPMPCAAKFLHLESKSQEFIRVLHETEFGQHTGNSKTKQSLDVFKGLSMTSEYVARRVVKLAKHPRRVVIIPWWYHIVIGFDMLFPAIVDWFLKQFFIRRTSSA